MEPSISCRSYIVTIGVAIAGDKLMTSDRRIEV
jgi:hypothetical protein